MIGHQTAMEVVFFLSIGRKGDMMNSTRKKWILLLCSVLVLVTALRLAAAGSHDVYLPITLKQPTNTPVPTATTQPTNTPQPANTPTTQPTGNAQITHIEYDPPDGTDLAGEYVDIQNLGGTFNMEGWRLYDNANTTFIFPDFTLNTGASVRVWVKSGTNNDSNLYWGRNRSVWNNDGDCGHLEQPDRTLVQEYCYP